jgi:hypothetical protein
MYTLFKKELRQHGILAVAMVFMCLCFQIGIVEWYEFIQVSIDGGSFFAFTLFMVVLYAGVAAALAYSTEHADNTFTFLRNLPISWQTVAVGKTAWVLCGTVLVLIGNLLLYAACIGTGFVTDTAFNGGRIATVLGVGTIEALVWGFFWSTRCRSQVHALIATCLCACVSLYLVTYFFAGDHFDPFEMYFSVIPHRLAVAGLVALAAVWGMSRWFSFEGKRPFLARLYPEKFTLPYPKQVQSPFFALVHQHIRHASIIYPLGILSMIGWTIGLTVASLGFAYNIESPKLDLMNRGDALWCLAVILIAAVYGSVFCMGLFWATIFGHDQKKNSYQFLSRLGVHEGTVWWSRMVPALVFYVPVILGFAAVGGAILYGQIHYAGFYANRVEETIWEHLWLWAPMGFTIWLAPMAVGAFISISFRSQMVAIALTAGGFLLPIFWGMFILQIFGCSPWWTTVPICIAILVASRIRAAYWLRETCTWRSRVIPLVPLFAVFLAVLTAIPFVRIYSVPHISWEQIDAYFDQANLGDMKRDPVKRKALLQHISQHGTVPPEYEIWLEKIKGSASEWELNILSGLTFEEYIILCHMRQYDRLDKFFSRDYWREQRESGGSYLYNTWSWLPFMPWERTRRERVLRCNLVANIAEMGGVSEKRAVTIRDLCKRKTDGHVLLDDAVWMATPGDFVIRIICFQQMRHVFQAIDKWYAEHGTLPESLDELVESGYLSAFPEHPFTAEQMEYYRNAHAPGVVFDGCIFSGVLSANDTDRHGIWSERQAQRDSLHETFLRFGGTYLRLGKWVYVIVEEERSQEAEFRK